MYQKFKELSTINNVTFVERSGDAMWQKFLGVKGSCRKMLGIWLQVRSPLKSGWVESDYKKSANEVWELRQGGQFEFWSVFTRLEAVLSAEDRQAEVLEDVADDSQEGTSSSKKSKDIKRYLAVKEEALSEMRQARVSRADTGESIGLCHF